MTKYFYGLVVICCISCSDEKKDFFTVEGTLKNSNARIVYLEENPADGRPMIVDSSTLGKDGKFSLTATGNEEGMFSLRYDNEGYPFAVLINDSKKITVEADPSNTEAPYSVKGSPASQSLLDFDRAMDERLQVHVRSVNSIDSLKKITGAKAEEKIIIDSLTRVRFSEYLTNAEGLKAYVKQFIQNSNSPVAALYAFGAFQSRASQYNIQGFNQTETGEIINEAVRKFPNHTVLNDQKKKLKPNTAPDFTMADANGNPVALSSFRGKYVLVDFWASWCAPCRVENPNVVAAYNQFRDKNFTILGVSLDKSKEAWLQAIQADGLTWQHVSDLQYWNNAAAVLYGVQSIPYNVLIDPSGTIVAENLRGNELHSALARILK